MEIVNKEHRKSYLDFLKILACISVIIMHLCINLNTSFFNWSVNKAFNIIGNFAVPIFVMVSGALLLNPKKVIKTKNIFLIYIPRLVFSLLIVNMFTVLVNGIINNNLSSSMFFTSIYGVFLNMVPVPYWYIYMMIGLYLVTPILKEWIKNANIKTIEYFLILFIAYRILAYTILNLPTIEFVSKFNSIYSSFQLPLITGYCGYYILGYYLTIKDFSKFKNYILLILLFLIEFLTIGLELFFGKHSANYVTSSTIFSDVFSINIFLISVILFILAKKTIKNYYKSLTIISNKTYGIYLFHVLGLNLLSLLNLDTEIPLIYIPLSTILVFTFSYICTFIFQKIPYINKFFR